MLTQEQMAEGKIIATYHRPGYTVHINDAAIAGVSPEELAARRAEAWRIAYGIDFRAQLRELAQKEEAEKTAG